MNIGISKKIPVQSLNDSINSIPGMKSGVIFECNNQRQQDSLQILEKAGIFDILHEYNPTWVGTIPLEINIPDSDLDIICEVYNFADFNKDCTRKPFKL